jgi:hypothetical protein
MGLLLSPALPLRRATRCLPRITLRYFAAPAASTQNPGRDAMRLRADGTIAKATSVSLCAMRKPRPQPSSPLCS